MSTRFVLATIEGLQMITGIVFTWNTPQVLNIPHVYFQPPAILKQSLISAILTPGYVCLLMIICYLRG